MDIFKALVRSLQMTGTPRVESAIQRIIAVRHELPAHRGVLVAVSGIDGSGKGYVSARMVEALVAGGLRVAALNVDGWLNLPHVRFDAARPAEHFYEHAIRFDEMFEQLVLPLRERRSLRVEADFVDETATEHRRHTYEFANVDVIVVEGIYLLKRAFCRYYDLSFWIDCSFETALERAVARAREGLSAEETVRAYRTIYFPAQELHFARDNARAAANETIDNDARPARAASL